MEPKQMSEYLVKIGNDVDVVAFNSALNLIKKVENALKKMGTAGKAAAVALTALTAVTTASGKIIKDVADADMQFKKLGAQMWITADSAKTLSTAMKVMHASADDIAWVPELREQFFRLRGEMNALATPKDADNQLSFIRSIEYDVQSLQVKLKMLKEWIAYYLIKYLRPYIEEFKKFIGYINQQLGSRMPDIAKKIAKALAQITSVFLIAIQTIIKIVKGVYGFIDRLPSNVKKWGAIFAAVGAAIMTGPFGMMIAAIGGALILLQDFVYYMNGWNSSKTLAPVWKNLLDLVHSDKVTKLIDGIEGGLKSIADTLDKIVDDFISGFDWGEIKDSWSEGLAELGQGVDALIDAVEKLFDDLNIGTSDKNLSRHRSFWWYLGHAVSKAIAILGKFIGKIGQVIKAIAQLASGNWRGAASTMGQMLGLTSGGDTNSVMKALMGAGLSKAGAAGVIGNLQVEDPGLKPDTVEGGKGVTAEEVLKMNREQFVNGDFGWGIAQWTDHDRKARLWDATDGDIGNLGKQLAFLVQELQQYYPEVWAKLQSGDISVQEAMEAFRDGYESPDGNSAHDYRRSMEANAAFNEYDDSATVAPTASNNKYRFDANSYAAQAVSSRPAFYPTTSTFSTTSSPTNISLGNITVNVGGSNATAGEIAQAVEDKLHARVNKGAFI